MNPLLSIVIPTKNRYFYLKHLITLIDSFHSDYIELVVQDNSDDNSTFVEYLNKCNYKNLNYFYNSGRLSQAENSDLAILNSKGDYVCFIGDDDGVTSHIIECVLWMNRNNIDALLSAPTIYKWPDYVSNVTDISNVLSFKPFRGNYQVVETKDVLSKALKNGFVNMEGLPRVYQGIVKRKVLDRIYNIAKTFHPGPSPDMACAVSLCFHMNNFVVLDFPIIITGASRNSGGGECVRKFKNKLSDINEVPFLPSNAKEQWEDSLPKYWSVETVWPESAIKAIRYNKKEQLISQINIEYTLAFFAVFHIPYLKISKKKSKNKIVFFSYFLYILCLRYCNGLRNLLLKRSFFSFLEQENRVYDLKNIDEVHKYLIKKYPQFPYLGDLLA
ncbi:glycosyltransferase family 2 protein [Bacteroides cutis]|uniref:glycosyltransferase family 2 protein n=1 Tax=Bacteroides cutis TaxID=2024197 RepID=UPI000C7758D6|nr:glycosyltransferase [Bacteroides cutis]